MSLSESITTINGSPWDYFDDEQPVHPRRTKSKKRKASPSNGPRSVGEQQKLDLVPVYPKTENQQKVFDYHEKGYHILLHGTAGTGKTFLSFDLALKDVLDVDTPYNKVYIIRSMVPSRDMGFLPGSMAEKAKVYESAYMGICKELFGRSDAYEILKKRGIIEFMPTSFLRGETFRDCIIILDECQNLSDQETNTVMTRLGDNSKVFICGDTKQDDLTGKKHEVSGIVNLIKAIGEMRAFKTVQFTVDDICRSETVKQWILAREKLGM